MIGLQHWNDCKGRWDIGRTSIEYVLLESQNTNRMITKAAERASVSLLYTCYCDRMTNTKMITEAAEISSASLSYMCYYNRKTTHKTIMKAAEISLVSPLGMRYCIRIDNTEAITKARWESVSTSVIHVAIVIGLITLKWHRGRWDRISISVTHLAIVIGKWHSNDIDATERNSRISHADSWYRPVCYTFHHPKERIRMY